MSDPVAQIHSVRIMRQLPVIYALNFRPWSDAPHHLVLQWLMEEREQLKETSGDMTIVAINDRAIVAVCQVIQALQGI